MSHQEQAKIVGQRWTCYVCDENFGKSEALTKHIAGMDHSFLATLTFLKTPLSILCFFAAHSDKEQELFSMTETEGGTTDTNDNVGDDEESTDEEEEERLRLARQKVCTKMMGTFQNCSIFQI